MSWRCCLLIFWLLTKYFTVPPQDSVFLVTQISAILVQEVQFFAHEVFHVADLTLPSRSIPQLARSNPVYQSFVHCDRVSTSFWMPHHFPAVSTYWNIDSWKSIPCHAHVFYKHDGLAMRCNAVKRILKAPGAGKRSCSRRNLAVQVSSFTVRELSSLERESSTLAWNSSSFV